VKSLAQKVTGILVVAILFSACGDDDKSPTASHDHDHEGHIDVPSAYQFDSRFTEGETSVSYSGQVVRNLLLQDLKILIGNLGKDGAQSVTVQDMMNLYDYDDALNLTSLTTTGSLQPLENKYSSISTGKNLKSKTSPDVVIGYGKTTDELMMEWFQIIADNSNDASKLGTPAVYTTDDGVDLAQMVNKVLIGAVPYYQATGNYFWKLLDKSNDAAKEGKTYTDMEHYWDEAWGYYGAAADYSRYTDVQLAGKTADDFAFDSNGDGYIDFKSEYNHGISRNAGKRDKGGTGVDLTSDIFNAFLRGRTHIVNQESEAMIIAERTAASNGMEKVIAATAVHYINDTLADMAENSDDKTNLNKHWGEMKGFTVALQFNPYALITTPQLEDLHMNFGQAPSYAAPGTADYDAAVAQLEAAKVIFQSAYGFSDANMAGW
tara:strand:- start:664 stop:1965 length:1302 start_codon:yes stop_codon:yes gene_type:complete